MFSPACDCISIQFTLSSLVEDKHEVVDRQEGNLEFAGVEDSHKAGHMLVEVRSQHMEELADQYETSAAPKELP